MVSYIPEKGESKAEQKGQWALGAKTEKQVQPVADHCIEPVMS